MKCIALFVGLIASAAVAQATAQDVGQAPTFRAGVDVVTMSVVVRDRDGRPVTGLTPAAFELLDAGRERPIVDMRSESSPISVAVLFDVSGSMDVGPKLPAARDAVRQLMAWLTPGDESALFMFDSRLHEVQPFTVTPGDVVRGLDSLLPFGATSLYDAIADTGRRLEVEGGPRRAVVVVTDGVDNGSRLTAHQLSAIAGAIDVPVYMIIVRSPLDHPGTETSLDSASTSAGIETLGDLARSTGGALFVTSAPAHTSTAARSIVAELRSQYFMAFEPSGPEGWHALALRTRDGRLTVQTRSGYVAGPRVDRQQ